jgi:hypothetical protein
LVGEVKLFEPIQYYHNLLLLRALYKLTKIGYFEPNSIGYCQLVWCSE